MSDARHSLADAAALVLDDGRQLLLLGAGLAARRSQVWE